MSEHRMIRSTALTIAALAAATAVPRSSNTATLTASTSPPPLPDIKRRQQRPSKFERESKRGSRPYRAKQGNSAADVARREKAEAKRRRKAKGLAHD